MTAKQISALALELGFSNAGVCSAEPPESYQRYKAWLDRGMHGTMDFMQRSAELRASCESILPGAQSVIAVTLNYNQPNPAVPNKPRIARYALGRDYHKIMRRKLRSLAGALSKQMASVEFRPCVDSAPILEREYANRAGLGWFGKNTCLIDSRRGSWFIIGLLLTTAKLDNDQPAVGNCGSCTACIDACPTQAIVLTSEDWQVDSRRCISYLTIEHKGAIDPSLQSKMEDWVFGCDICQEVCPFNQPRESQPERARVTTEFDLLQKRDWPSLQQLAGLNYEDWDRLTQGSPVRRARYEGLRRSALRVLGEGV